MIFPSTESALHPGRGSIYGIRKLLEGDLLKVKVIAGRKSWIFDPYTRWLSFSDAVNECGQKNVVGLRTRLEMR